MEKELKNSRKELAAELGELVLVITEKSDELEKKVAVVNGLRKRAVALGKEIKGMK